MPPMSGFTTYTSFVRTYVNLPWMLRKKVNGRRRSNLIWVRGPQNHRIVLCQRFSFEGRSVGQWISFMYCVLCIALIREHQSVLSSNEMYIYFKLLKLRFLVLLACTSDKR
ncbi:hypothetical protein BDN70DRAFT_570771 [Pholiota conissans]|uniref:Uncharacterized protein n=1 Tax=Pholiota conissans TaxID=109636 RepID=A0A9P6CLR2_9AGAR|nr:hypothetical protein BDN70DRAFT_570771 [Pholiota conissans]